MPLLQAVVPLAEKRPMEGYSEPSIPLLQLSFRVSNSQARDLVVKHIAVTSSPGLGHDDSTRTRPTPPGASRALLGPSLPLLGRQCAGRARLGRTSC